MVIFGTVSKVDYSKARVDVAVKDQEDMILQDVPFFSWMYKMPKKEDYVVIVSEDKSEDKFSHMVCLGTPYSDKRKPNKNGKDVVYIEFPDGTYIHYDPKKKQLETNAEKVKAKDIIVDNIKAKNITADDVTTKTSTVSNNLTAGDIVYHNTCVKG